MEEKIDRWLRRLKERRQGLGNDRNEETAMPTPYIKKLASEGKGSVSELEKKWNEAKKAAAKQGKGDNFAYVTDIFQKMVHASVVSTIDKHLEQIQARLETATRIPGPASTSDSAINSLMTKFDFWPNHVIENPFKSSKLPRIMFHGTPHTGNMQFRIPSNGLWFAEDIQYAKDEYTGNGSGKVWACYIDVRKLYIPTEDEQDEWYGEETSEFFKSLLAKGYDSYWQGMASGAVAILKKVPIINAISGERMDSYDSRTTAGVLPSHF